MYLDFLACADHQKRIAVVKNEGAVITERELYRSRMIVFRQSKVFLEELELRHQHDKLLFEALDHLQQLPEINAGDNKFAEQLIEKDCL